MNDHPRYDLHERRIRERLAAANMDRHCRTCGPQQYCHTCPHCLARRIPADIEAEIENSIRPTTNAITLGSNDCHRPL